MKVLAALLMLSGPAAAQQAIQRTGTCPTGYRTSGNYCVPYDRDAGHAVKKDGQCPTGYRSSGDYCVQYGR